MKGESDFWSTQATQAGNTGWLLTAQMHGEAYMHRYMQTDAWAAAAAAVGVPDPTWPAITDAPALMWRHYTICTHLHQYLDS